MGPCGEAWDDMEICGILKKNLRASDSIPPRYSQRPHPTRHRISAGPGQYALHSHTPKGSAENTFYGKRTHSTQGSMRCAPTPQNGLPLHAVVIISTYT